jgi:type II secretory pathway component PulF
MNLVLGPRHWAIMIGAVILAIAAVVLLPQVASIYSMTTYAFPAVSLAVILNILGTATERGRWPMKALAC